MDAEAIAARRGMSTHFKHANDHAVLASSGRPNSCSRRRAEEDIEARAGAATNCRLENDQAVHASASGPMTASASVMRALAAEEIASSGRFLMTRAANAHEVLHSPSGENAGRGRIEDDERAFLRGRSNLPLAANDHAGRTMCGGSNASVIGGRAAEAIALISGPWATPLTENDQAVMERALSATKCRMRLSACADIADRSGGSSKGISAKDQDVFHRFSTSKSLSVLREADDIADKSGPCLQSIVEKAHAVRSTPRGKLAEEFS